MAKVSPQTLVIQPHDVPRVVMLGAWVFIRADGDPCGPALQLLSIDHAETWLDQCQHDLAMHKAQLRLALGDEASDAVVYGERAS